MNVGIVQASPGVVKSRTDAQNATLNYDAFLKLLLEQLKSQDPTNPVDQAESLAQLASFSGLEQAIKTNQKLDALLIQSNLAEAVALSGKRVQSLTSELQGVVASIEIRPNGTELVLQDGARIPMSQGIRVLAS